MVSVLAASIPGLLIVLADILHETMAAKNKIEGIAGPQDLRAERRDNR